MPGYVPGGENPAMNKTDKAPKIGDGRSTNKFQKVINAMEELTSVGVVYVDWPRRISPRRGYLS